MLTVRIWTEYGQGTVDPFWDPLSPEHGLPRNLVFVIVVIVFVAVCAAHKLYVCYVYQGGASDASADSDRSVRELPLTLHSVNR